MEKYIISIEELNAIITGAVEAALDARETNEPDKMLTRKAVAERLHVDVSTLWRWHKANVLPVTARVGRTVYYSEKLVAAFEKGERLIK